MKAKILIVDDEPMLLRLVGYALHKEGYETVIAKQGEEALGKVKTERPDLVILDIMLPDMDGIEVCRRLRGRPETTTLPVMMLSARGQVPDKVMGLRAGADEYMTKPIQHRRRFGQEGEGDHSRRAQALLRHIFPSVGSGSAPKPGRPACP
jgi:DNA-binding response OmpR family regulator